MRLVGRLLKWTVLAVGGYLALCLALLVAYRWIDPLTTTVHLQRVVEGLAEDGFDYRYHAVPSDEMSSSARWALVASEDTRFFQHAGFDWEELKKARESAERTGKPMRGASTITQQLVKNLFLTTHRSVVRKGFEVPLTLAAEAVLSKERILTLYANVIEFGPDGLFGIDAAARHYYGVPAARLSREQAARLAAVVPNPHDRRPDRMGSYAGTVQTRMRQMGH